MNKISVLFSLVLVSLLSSCSFLLSPLGEELIEDVAVEAVKIEHELVHPSAPVVPAAPSEKKVENGKI